MKHIALTLGLTVASLMAIPAFGQDEDEEARFATLTATAAPIVPADGLIAIDMQCRDEDAEIVEARLVSWLRERGFKVEDRAPLTLRVEVTPCEDVGLLPGRGSVADAYGGSSDLDEFSRARPSVRIPLGKDRDSDYRVSVRFLLFQPGKKPLWSAHIVGKSSALKQRSAKVEFATAALQVFGQTAEKKILIE